MTEILGQKEIDALLQGADTAAPETQPEVVPYNFVRPPRVSKDRRSSLEAIHARFALSLQAQLSSRLRAPVDVVLESLEQVAFSDFVLAIGSPCAAYVFKVGDRGEGVLDLGNDVAFHFLDRLFGGPGEPGRVERPLTALEQTVVRSIAERMLALLREAWQEQLPVRSDEIGYESNPEMLQIAGRGDTVLVANLKVRSATGGGFVTLCLPMSTLEPYLEDRTAARPQPREAHGTSAAARPLLECCLQHAGLTVRVRLPAIRLSTREIVGLQSGQVIEIGQGPEAPVDLYVNDRLRFRATLGQTRGRIGVRIQQTVNAPAAERPGRAREGRVM